MGAAKHGLSKSEILRHKRSISNIFSSADAIKVTCFPLKFIVISVKNPEPGRVEVLFTVPVRNIKRAVDRNLIRRRMKEAYRIQKAEIQKVMARDKSLNIGVIYISKEILSFEVISSALLNFKHEFVKKHNGSVV